MNPYQQGGLDSLCGIYSIVNAERIINGTTIEESEVLFCEIMRHLDKKKRLYSILTNGMLLKDVKQILNEIVRDRIPVKQIQFAGKTNPDLSTFWKSMQEFLSESSKKAILLGLSGFHDHWTIISSITEKQIQLADSDSLQQLNRSNCTTYDIRGQRHHILWPAQTYFLAGNI